MGGRKPAPPRPARQYCDKPSRVDGKPQNSGRRFGPHPRNAPLSHQRVASVYARWHQPSPSPSFQSPSSLGKEPVTGFTHHIFQLQLEAVPLQRYLHQLLMKRSQLSFIALVASHKVVIMESVVAVVFNAQAVAQQTGLVAVVGLGLHAAQIEIHLLVVEQVVKGGDHVVSGLNRNQVYPAAGPLVLNQAAVETYKIRVGVAALVRACTPTIQV